MLETEKTEIPSKGLLECKETTFYAGKVKSGQPVEHIFSFVNIGTEPVIILEKTTFINGIGFYKRDVEFLKGKRELNLLLKEFKELDKIIVNDKHYIFYDGIKTYHVFEQ